MPATSEAELRAILESLDNRKQAWAALGAAERAALLRETLKTTSAVSLPTLCHEYAELLSMLFPAVSLFIKCCTQTSR